MRDLKVGLIQSDIAWHDVDANEIRFDALVASLREPMDLLLLPEMFTTGFTMDPASHAEGMDGRGVRSLKRWAREKNTAVAGSLAIREEGRYYNRFILAGPDGNLAIYDKRHLFRMAGEETVYTAGSGRALIDIQGWKIRPFICYDLRFPVWSRNGNPAYDIAVYVANWPEQRREHWRALLRARAIENQCYCIGVNRIGADGNGILHSGDSAVIDFRGETLFEAANEECCAVVDCSYDALAEYRGSFPVWKDADAFGLFP